MRKEYPIFYTFDSRQEADTFFDHRESKDHCFFKIKGDDTKIYFINDFTNNIITISSGGGGGGGDLQSVTNIGNYTTNSLQLDYGGSGAYIEFYDGVDKQADFAITDGSMSVRTTSNNNFSIECIDLTDNRIYKLPDINGTILTTGGTTSGFPITGNIETQDYVVNIGQNVTENEGVTDGLYSYSRVDGSGSYTLISGNKTNNTVSVLTVGQENIVINSSVPTSRGIIGNQDFTANITDLDYTQKKYVDEQINNVIPLSGTNVNNPVTGDIDMANSNLIFNNIDGDKFIKFGYNPATDETGFWYDNGVDFQTRFRIYNGAIESFMPNGSIISHSNIGLGVDDNGNPLYRGVIGGADYTANITDLDYTQKIYVDDIAGKIITLGTVTFEDLNSTGLGENNVIIPLDFQNVPVGYYIECFYYDVSEAFDKSMSNDADVAIQDPTLTSTIDITSLGKTVKRTTSIIFPASSESTGDTFTIHLTDANDGTATTGSITVKALIKKFPN